MYMKVENISKISFNNNQNRSVPQKREFIDKLTDAVTKKMKMKIPMLVLV